MKQGKSYYAGYQRGVTDGQSIERNRTARIARWISRDGWRSQVWTTKEKIRIPVDDMEPRHAFHAANMLLRNALAIQHNEAAAFDAWADDNDGGWVNTTWQLTLDQAQANMRCREIYKALRLRSVPYLLEVSFADRVAQATR